MIKRYYSLENEIKPQKVLVLYGPRRVGKTTLLQAFLGETKLKYRQDVGEDIRVQRVMSSQDVAKIKEYASGYDLIAIDEAQNIPNVGLGLKILIDQVPNISVIATGSSSFDLSQQVGEPLTGRKRTLVLYPISQLELRAQDSPFNIKERLEDFLIFGSYPEVVEAKTKKEKIEILTEMVNSYVLKDIFVLEQIRGSQKLFDLLKLIAFQVGREVSYSELAERVGLDVKTVLRYLDLFEKVFILKRVGGLSRNQRREISRKQKYYFLDNGIRNSLIAQFNPLEDRDDIGPLFENFVVMERLKANAYLGRYSNIYFWRTYTGQEIDYIEEREGGLFGYEVKWATPANVRVPSGWSSSYPRATYEIITRESYFDFVTT